jgi:hypothetical protein
MCAEPPNLDIYLACALTHVPEPEFDGYTERIHRFAAALCAQGANQVRYALINSDPQLAAKPAADKARLCYLWDRRMVESADVFVAEATHPSLGLGIEMQIAESNDIPLIMCFEKAESRRTHSKHYRNPDRQAHKLQVGEGFVSLMALGLPNVFSVIPYRAEEECLRGLATALQLLNDKQ